MTHTAPAKWIAAWILCAIVFVIVASCAKGLTPAERDVVTQMKDTITELRTKLDAQVAANASALQSLSLAVVQAVDLTTAAQHAQEQDQLKDDGIVKDKKIAFLNQKYQFAQFLIAAVSAFAVALLVFQFTRSLPAPYNFILPLGGAGFAYGIITILI